MHPPQPHSEAPHVTVPIRRAIFALIGIARDLLGRVTAAITYADISHLPRRLARNPLAAEQRLLRTLDWIGALARTLAGDTFWLIAPTTRAPRVPAPPQPTAPTRVASPRRAPPRTEAQKAAAHLRYVRTVFATQPVATIAARLARRLGIRVSDRAWPTALIAITKTPAACARAIYARERHALPPGEATRAVKATPPGLVATGPPRWA